MFKIKTFIILFLFIFCNIFHIANINRNTSKNNVFSKKRFKKKHYFFVIKYVDFHSKPNFIKKNKKKFEKTLGRQRRLYFSHTYKNKKIEYGYSLLKNPGENFFTANKKKIIFGFHSNNEYFAVHNCSFIKDFIIGDFNVGYGQGLIFNNTFGFGNPFDQIKILKIQHGISPTKNHTINKIKGVGATFSVSKNIEITTLCGINFLDGNVKDFKVTSVQRRLIYNIQKNISLKNVLIEKILGGTFLFKTKNDDFEFGINAVRTKFNIPLNFINYKKLEYLFTGDFNINYGFFSRLAIGPAHFFIEAAKSLAEETTFSKTNGQGHGFIFGVISNILKNFDIALCYRQYSANYYNFYGQSFCKYNSGNCSQLKGAGRNEKGYYIAFLLKILYNLDLKCSFDVFLNKQKSYNYINRLGHEVNLLLNYILYKKYNIYFNIKHIVKKYNLEKKNKNINNSNFFYCKFNVKKYINENLNIDVQMHSSFTLLENINIGLYHCINYSNFSCFFIIAKSNEKNLLYITTKGLYQDSINTTKIRTNMFKLGIKIKCIIFYIRIDFMFTYEYKPKEIKIYNRHYLVSKIFFFIKT